MTRLVCLQARILLSVPSPDEGSFSPGTVFGCRLAVQTPSDKSKSGNVGTNVFLASGRSVYRTSVPAPVAGDLAKGKEGVLIPKVYEEPVKGHRLEFVQHIAEIQSINMVERNGGLLASRTPASIA